MAERTTKTVTTPSGKSVALKEYITAGEFIDLNAAKDAEQISKVELAKRLLDIAVVSIDGNAENVSQALRDLPLPDYTFLSKEVAKLVGGDFTEAKAQ